MRNDLSLLDDVEQYLSRYVVFPSPDLRFTTALWLIGTYLWPELDVYPYLVITSSTKRSGKTRLAELLSFVASNPRWLTAGTAPTMFYMIRDENPTILVDEAETMTSEAAGTMRSALNAGYRRGQTIPRMGQDKKVEHWPVYCPKVFILIGDVNDTLRDRSIILTMQRASAVAMEQTTRFVWGRAEQEGNAIGLRIKAEVEDNRKALLDAFDGFAGLPFLTDRDEELWTPLFVLAQTFGPARVTALQRIAVDLSTEKTAEARAYSALKHEGAEEVAQDDEYAQRLLRDLLTVMNGAKYITTADALFQLQELTTGPWRKYQGTGLTPISMAALLSRFPSVSPKPVRMGKQFTGKGQPVKRGYARHDIERALKAI